MKQKALIMNQSDNVVTALADLKKDTKVKIIVINKQIIIRVNSQIPFGHKFALTDIAKADDVIKYGEVIGKATQKIRRGDHVHLKNLESKRARGDLSGSDLS